MISRVLLVSLCLFIGNFFSKDYFGIKYSNCLVISIIAQTFFTIYSSTMCIIQLIKGSLNIFDPINTFSLLFFFKEFISNTSQIGIIYPLRSINIIEFLFYCTLIVCLSKITKTPFIKSLIYTTCTYGLGFVLFLITNTFLFISNV